MRLAWADDLGVVTTDTFVKGKLYLIWFDLSAEAIEVK